MSASVTPTQSDKIAQSIFKKTVTNWGVLGDKDIFQILPSDLFDEGKPFSETLFKIQTTIGWQSFPWVRVFAGADIPPPVTSDMSREQRAGILLDQISLIFPAILLSDNFSTTQPSEVLLQIQKTQTIQKSDDLYRFYEAVSYLATVISQQPMEVPVLLANLILNVRWLQRADSSLSKEQKNKDFLAFLSIQHAFLTNIARHIDEVSRVIFAIMTNPPCNKKLQPHIQKAKNSIKIINDAPCPWDLESSFVVTKGKHFIYHMVHKAPNESPPIIASLPEKCREMVGALQPCHCYSRNGQSFVIPFSTSLNRKIIFPDGNGIVIKCITANDNPAFMWLRPNKEKPDFVHPMMHKNEMYINTPMVFNKTSGRPVQKLIRRETTLTTNQLIESALNGTLTEEERISIIMPWLEHIEHNKHVAEEIYQKHEGFQNPTFCIQLVENFRIKQECVMATMGKVQDGHLIICTESLWHARLYWLGMILADYLYDEGDGSLLPLLTQSQTRYFYMPYNLITQHIKKVVPSTARQNLLEKIILEKNHDLLDQESIEESTLSTEHTFMLFLADFVHSIEDLSESVEEEIASSSEEETPSKEEPEEETFPVSPVAIDPTTTEQTVSSADSQPSKARLRNKQTKPEKARVHLNRCIRKLCTQQGLEVSFRMGGQSGSHIVFSVAGHDSFTMALSYNWDLQIPKIQAWYDNIVANEQKKRAQGKSDLASPQASSSVSSPMSSPMSSKSSKKKRKSKSAKSSAIPVEK